MKYFIILLLLSVTAGLSAQDSQVDASIQQYHLEDAAALMRDLPNGIYNDHKAFVKKNPSSTPELVKRVSASKSKSKFYFADSDKSIGQVFAVVLNSEVYFQTRSILRHRTTDSGGMFGGGGRYFEKAEIMGPFLYMEDYLTPAAGVLVGVVVGGIIGGAIVAAISSKSRPIIFVNHLGKFRIIKNFNHFKTFIDSKYPEYSHLVESKYHMIAITKESKLEPVVKEILSKITK